MAQAAHLLGISQQFLVNLLESGDLPYHTVGTHRRVYLKDLLEYKAKRDVMRRTILDKMLQSELDAGVGRVLPDGCSR